MIPSKIDEAAKLARVSGCSEGRNRLRDINNDRDGLALAPSERRIEHGREVACGY